MIALFWNPRLFIWRNPMEMNQGRLRHHPELRDRQIEHVRDSLLALIVFLTGEFRQTHANLEKRKGELHVNIRIRQVAQSHL